jgi:hypothetical protein
MSRGLPTPVDKDIEDSIADASTRGLMAVVASPTAELVEHVIKFTAAPYGGRYPPSPRARTHNAVYISPSPGFTWGAAVYVCPLAFPLSSAIYGRCGIVAKLGGWRSYRIFDAANPRSASLYVAWSQLQPMSNMLALTTHSQLANQTLRNAFRTRFNIDVVVFPPDEMNRHYTNRRVDRWLAVSDWSSSGRLKTSGPSGRLSDPRLVVVTAEEFEAVQSGIGRRTQIGPSPSFFGLRPKPADVLAAYRSGNTLVVQP